MLLRRCRTMNYTSNQARTRPGSPGSWLTDGMDIYFPIYLFDTSKSPGVAQSNRDQELRGGNGRRLRCHACNHEVTDESERISINQSHSHIRTNPGGFEYHFQCFGNAPGCSVFGQTTHEHTWFAGHRWQVAICGHCGEHLGWLFRGESSFYGLISNRLVPDPG